MANENEMEKAISVEIAARSPFTAQEVYSAWQSCKSFDMVLAAVEYCATFGLANLSSAISCLTPRPPDSGEAASNPVTSE